MSSIQNCFREAASYKIRYVAVSLPDDWIAQLRKGVE
jgi:hypothetical protein